MDPFECFPVEIIQSILSYTADYVGIESLLSVSPWVNTVFHDQPRTITLQLIKSNPISTIPEIACLMRDISVLNTPSIHCKDIGKYTQLRKGIRNVLPQQMTPQEIRQLIHIAAKVQRLACICLYTMQKNFATAVRDTRGWEAGQKAEMPLSWTEEYRVYWALWHLQHYTALKQHAKYHWGWAAESLNAIDTYIIFEGPAFTLKEQIWTVAAILADLGLCPFYNHPGDYLDWAEEEDEEATGAAWDYPYKTPCPFFASLTVELLHDHEKYRIWSPAPAPDLHQANVWFWGRARRSIEEFPSPTAMFRAVGRMLTRVPPRTCRTWQMMRMQPYRRLGVVFWDHWRMYRVGLYDASSSEPEITPDGDILPGCREGMEWPEIASRWLALVGKRLPDRN